MVTGPQVVELTFVKVVFFTLGQKSNPGLEWKKANIFKMNGDDDEVLKYLNAQYNPDSTAFNK